MSDAVAKSIHRLTVALDLLERSAAACETACDAVRRSPTPLSAIASDICADVGMVDIEAAIHIMDRLAAQAKVRARHIGRLTAAIAEA